MEIHNDLLKKVSQLGFPLLETESKNDPNDILADVIKSHDPRLWEGFPVMLANTGEKDDLDIRQIISSTKEPRERETLRHLVSMSVALFDFKGLNFHWAQKSLKQSPFLSIRNEILSYLMKFKAGYDFDIGNFRLSSKKILNVFETYYKRNDQMTSDLIQTREEMGLEFALSQLFSSKQKDLIHKKLRREKLTKTENEYYSRLVKKKLLAVSNPELQRLARQIVGQ